MAEQKITNVSGLTADPRNPRKHGERNIRAIAKSLEEVGTARSIVIDEHGTVLCGNGLIDAASIVGIENVRVVESDGQTIIAVRRTGLTDKQKKRLAVLDNRSSELAEWDGTVLAELLDEGIALDDLFYPDELSKLLDNAVTGLTGIEAPGEFKEFGEDIETEYCCPKCSYKWSGKPS